MASVVRAAGLQGFDGVVSARGVDPERLRRRHGLSGDDPEAMVSLEAVARLLESAAVECQCPDLGLQIGTSQDPRVLGLLAVVIRGADTIGAALLDAARHLFVHSPAYRLGITPPSSDTRWVTVAFDIELDEAAPYRQLVDACLSSLLANMRALSGLPVLPASVSLPHTPLASRSTYESAFEAPLAFAQPRAALHLDPQVLHTRLEAVRPEIRRTALDYILEHHPAADHTMVARVRSALMATIGKGRVTKGETATLLGLHPRTLQRRLSDEGTTFEAVHDQVARAATRRLLVETDLPLGQVAHVLGFSEQSAMSRKVRTWYQLTPSQVRERG